MFTGDMRLDDFVKRAFRDIADEDYVAARMSYRAQLTVPFLWSSQQAIEKYLKAILLLHRIEAAKVKHSLGKAIDKIQQSKELVLDLTESTDEFVRLLDDRQCRYGERCAFMETRDLICLDQAVWEIRRYCAPDGGAIKLIDGEAAPQVRIKGGRLERIIDQVGDAARSALLWQNKYFWKRRPRRILLPRCFHATNSPLYNFPELLEEVSKFVHIPKAVKEAYGNSK